MCGENASIRNDSRAAFINGVTTFEAIYRDWMRFVYYRDDLTLRRLENVNISLLNLVIAILNYHSYTIF